jgi:lipoprotein-anchoring transpeptidase ErfK/SrfK
VSEAVKWIGGTTVVALVLLGSAVIAGNALEAAGETAPPDAVEAPAAEPAAFVEPEPAPSPDPFVIRSILPIDGPIRYGEWHWDESRAPAEGPLVMTVDLDARVLSVFRGGHEIGAAAVLLGTPQHPTPTGVFPILAKQRHNTSSIYNNAPMPWTMRLTWDGIAIHGGSSVERGYASHGCISGPDPFISKLFAVASKGDTVIITRGKKAELGTPLATL